MRSSCFSYRSRHVTVAVVSLLALATWSTVALGQNAGQTAEYSLRTYDVGDLVLNVPDYPYPPDTGGLPGGGMGGGGGGFGGGGGGFGARNTGSVGRVSARLSQVQAGATDSAGITMDDILRVVTNVVAPSEWSDNGGEGEIQRLGTSLVVWQTAAVHDHVGNLLEQLRAESGERRTVTIDARWLLLNSDELNEMLQDSAGPAQVDREVLATYTRRPASIRGVTNCFSGQLVYIVGGTRRNHVSGQIPVVGSVDHGEDAAHFAGASQQPAGGPRFILAQFQTQPGGGGEYGGGAGGGFPGMSGGGAGLGAGMASGVGYQPIIEKTNFGALLEIRPTVMKGGKEAVVNVISTVSAPGAALQSAQNAGDYGMASPMVDRVAIEIQELATTFRVPLGKPVLVGGLTYRPSTDGSDAQPLGSGEAAQAEAGENSQLYLILELR